jgi:hypothetical protein
MSRKCGSSSIDNRLEFFHVRNVIHVLEEIFESANFTTPTFDTTYSVHPKSPSRQHLHARKPPTLRVNFLKALNSFTSVIAASPTTELHQRNIMPNIFFWLQIEAIDL